MPTRYNVARQAIDEAIELSITMEEFQTEMKNRGYLLKFDPKLKYWSIVPPGWKKPIRIHKLGDDYTREKIFERISENDITVRVSSKPQPFNAKNYQMQLRELANDPKMGNLDWGDYTGTTDTEVEITATKSNYASFKRTILVVVE